MYEFPLKCLCVHVCAFPCILGVHVCVNYSYNSNEQM